MIYLDNLNTVWRSDPPNNWVVVGSIHDGKFIPTPDATTKTTLEVSTELPNILAKEHDSIYYVTPKSNTGIRYACNQRFFLSESEAVAYKNALGDMFVVCYCVPSDPQTIKSVDTGIPSVRYKK